MTVKKNKSDSYQHKIIEISVDPSILNEFSMYDGLSAQINLAQFSEQFYNLRQQLMAEVLRIVKNHLTKRQEEVVLLRLEGKTQTEVAEILKIHQTTVHKLLSGNIDYSNGRRYGGAYKKLKKICLKDTKVLEILKAMEELKIKDMFDEEE
jgi:DNA-binding CsgD family transcriptional regulator